MTVKKAAERAEVSVRTISTWIREGMPAKKDGREKRIQLADLTAEIRKRAEAKKERGARIADRRSVEAP